MEYNHEETMRLIDAAQKGDEQAKTALVTQNMPLIKSIVKRYLGKGTEYQDLVQIAAIGLLKAVSNFSLSYEVRFSTYAVPMIVGEIKRFIRDDGYVKVSRSIKSLSVKIMKFTEEFKKNFQAEPTVNDIAKNFNIEPSEVVFVTDSIKIPLSLYDKTDNGDEKGLSLAEKLSTDQKEDDVINRVILKSVINKLSPKEKKIIILRYFRDYTQGDIAKMMGVSQVQVSRLENKILLNIRQEFDDKQQE